MLEQQKLPLDLNDSIKLNHEYYYQFQRTC